MRSLRLLAAVCCSLATGVAGAANCVAIASAAWNVNTTWATCGGGVPGAADTATIVGFNVNIPANYAAQATTVDVGSGGNNNASTLTFSANTSSLNVGTLNVNRPNGNAVNTLLVNQGAVTVTGNLSFAGNTGTQSNRRAAITITTGTVSVTGNLVFSAPAGAGTGVNVITMSGGAGTLNLGGAMQGNTGVACTNITGTLTPGATSTFNYNGAAAQTACIGVSSVVYNNLHINNTDATTGATLSADITATNVAGNVRIGTVNNGSLLSDGGFLITGGAGDTFQIASGSTFKMTRAANGVSGFTTFDYGTVAPCGTFEYALNGAQTVSATAPNYGNLTLSTGGTKTLPAGTLTASCDYTQKDGTTVTATPTTFTVGQDFNLQNTASFTATNPVSVTRDVTLAAGTTFSAGTSTHNVGRHFNNNGATFNANTSTFNFNGAAAQTIGGTAQTTFNNVTANNAAGVSLAQNERVDATLTLTSGTFAVGAFTLILNGPTIAGTPTNLSTTNASTLDFGGTSSGVNVPSSVTALANLKAQNTRAGGGTLLTLNSDIAVATQLTLNMTTNGVLNTNGKTLTLSADCPGSVSRTAGWVAGYLKLNFPAGASNCTFDVGDAATNYTPVALAFAAGTTAGALTATVTSPDHPDTAVTATSSRNGLNPASSVNRYWTLQNSTVAGTYTATFTYAAGDIDGGSNATFKAVRGDACATSGGVRTCNPWGLAGTSTNPSGTTTQVTGLSLISGDFAKDFAIGATATGRFVRQKEFVYSRELF